MAIARQARMRNRTHQVTVINTDPTYTADREEIPGSVTVGTVFVAVAYSNPADAEAEGVSRRRQDIAVTFLYREDLKPGWELVLAGVTYTIRSVRPSPARDHVEVLADTMLGTSI